VVARAIDNNNAPAPMTTRTSPFRPAVTVAVALLLAACGNGTDPAATAEPAKPALTVETTAPRRETLPLRLAANGSIAAWQEASIGTEANGLRLAEVRVNVGDVVKRGQVLATFAPATVEADVAQIRAARAEAEAGLAEAAANARRARDLADSGAYSRQQVEQYLTAERTAQARVEAQRAAARAQQLRLAQTRVVAPDDGVISARSATVGAVLPAGQELFRLIRRGRLEWRAEVPAADLARLKPGRAATLTLPGGSTATGTLRMLAPIVDAQTRNGIAYVDLVPARDARAGMFARGEFELGSAPALTLPQSAVLLREGYSYVMRVGADGKVLQTKVATGRRVGERVEITGGLDAEARVVAAGGAFLADGDTVRIAAAAASAPAAGASR
jgi:RND family efflux transporter MFP subunit